MEDIINRLRNGDHAAFNEVFHNYSRYVYMVAYGVLHDAESAKDVVQDVFCRLWLKKGCLSDDKSLGGYLFCITKSIAIDISRHRSLEIKGPDVTDQTNEEPDNDGGAKVDQAIRKLSDSRQKLLVMRYKDGLSPKEISKITGLKIQSVWNSINESVKILRKDLANVEH